jgi:hypothetical protein
MSNEWAPPPPPPPLSPPPVASPPDPPYAYGAPTPAGAPVVKPAVSSRAWLLGVGGAVTVLGSLLPWVTVSVFGQSISKNGIDADGRITIALGFALLALIVVHVRRRRDSVVLTRVLALADAALVGGIFAIDYADVSNKADGLAAQTQGFAHASAGVGLWMVLVGAVLAAIGAFVVRPAVTA